MRYLPIVLLIGTGLCAALFVYQRDSSSTEKEEAPVAEASEGASLETGEPEAVNSPDETPLADERVRVGRLIGDFRLETVDGEPRQLTLADWQDVPVVVAVFLGTNCPLAERYSSRLSTIDQDYGEQAAILGVFSNRGDDPDEIRQFAEDRAISFPVLKDWDNRLADQLGAEKTPEAFVLVRESTGAERVVSYVGRIDDQFKVGVHGIEPGSHDLRDAIDAALSGADPLRSEVACEGCVIERRREGEPAQKPTVEFATVRHILEEHCLMCHRQGQPGFSLEDPADVRDMAANIVYRTSPEREGRHRMPPWNARTEVESGFTMSQLLLSPSDWETLATWHDEGALIDDFDSRLAPRQSAAVESEDATDQPVPQPLEEYTILLPELEVPAEGFDGNKYLLIDPGITKDVLAIIRLVPVKGVELIHHAALTVYTEDEGGSADEKMIELLTHQGPTVSGWLPGMTDGEKAGFNYGNQAAYSGETATLLLAGGRLIGQFHLQSKGEVGRVAQMEMRVQIFDPQVVKYVPDFDFVWNVNFKIPPHAKSHEIHTKRLLSRDLVAVGFIPHGHKRLKKAYAKATFPDGNELLLLEADYSEDWQWIYFLREERFFPKGTIVETTFTYENTEEYLAGAADPSQVVRSGKRTTDEMCQFNFACRQPADDVKRLLSSQDYVAPFHDRERIRIEPVDAEVRSAR